MSKIYILSVYKKIIVKTRQENKMMSDDDNFLKSENDKRATMHKIFLVVNCFNKKTYFSCSIPVTITGTTATPDISRIVLDKVNQTNNRQLSKRSAPDGLPV